MLTTFMVQSVGSLWDFVLMILVFMFTMKITFQLVSIPQTALEATQYLVYSNKLTLHLGKSNCSTFHSRDRGAYSCLNHLILNDTKIVGRPVLQNSWLRISFLSVIALVTFAINLLNAMAYSIVLELHVPLPLRFNFTMSSSTRSFLTVVIYSH